MRMEVKAMTVALGVGWGFLAMFVTGATNLSWPSDGGAFLEVMAPIYPLYDGSPRLGQVLPGKLLGLADGALAGLVFASLYNRFAR